MRFTFACLLACALGCTRSSFAPQDAGARPVSAFSAAPSVAAAQTAGTARLEGRVQWQGPRPVLAPLPTSPSAQSVCGASVADNALQVEADGGVLEAVVWVDAPAEALSPGGPGPAALIDQRGCLYWPAVLAARAGGTLRIRNSDPLTHTVHAFDEGLSLFNLAMPLAHMELSRQLPLQPGVVEFRCDVHPWMRAVLRTFAHSHYTTTGPGGRFQLPGLPPGDYVLHVWHPKLGEASRRLQVGVGAATADFEFGGMK